MHHRERIGRVVSSKMMNTVVVSVPWLQHHPRYRKAIRRVTRLYAHDPHSKCLVGDRVRVVEVRPLSKIKRWLVQDIVERIEVAEAPRLEEAVTEATSLLSQPNVINSESTDEAVVAEDSDSGTTREGRP